MVDGYMEKDNMAKKKSSDSEKIVKALNKQLKSADEIRQELKDRFGFTIKADDLRVNLLRLLRREKIHREKIDKIYKYRL